MARILDTVKPRRILAPFYTCNSLLAPAKERGVEIGFLRINEQLYFVSEPAPGPSDLLVLIDHFGVRTGYHTQLAMRHSSQAVLDLTHSFYTSPPHGTWGFNSARKFFGVPDGAFLFGPGRLEPPANRNEQVHSDHLILRTLSSGEAALGAFRTNEARMTTSVLGASLLSEKILRCTDLESARQKRCANFKAAHAVLGPVNELHVQDDDLSGPLCYPLLLDHRVDHTQFHGRGIFTARYWPDVTGRVETGSYPLESGLVERLVAVPVDQRYTIEQVDRVAWEIRRMI